MTTIDRIKAIARTGAVDLTLHAKRELANDGFTTDDLLAAIDTAVLLEDYPDDRRGASCLIYGKAKDGRPLHVVVTTSTPRVVVITVYEPKPPKWTTPTQRGSAP